MCANNKILIIAPHPDDEVIGCGGTILKHIQKKDEVYCVFFTKYADNNSGLILERNKEIDVVSKKLSFTKYFKLEYITATLDKEPLNKLIADVGTVFKEIQPNVVYVPFPGDIHSDHKVVFNASVACTKWFRYPSVRKVLCYETVSETDFFISPEINNFSPNLFVDITPFMEKKIEIASIYKSEFGEHPFPRNSRNIKALATIRGASCGSEFAEAFMLLKEIT